MTYRSRALWNFTLSGLLFSTLTVGAKLVLGGFSDPLTAVLPFLMGPLVGYLVGRIVLRSESRLGPEGRSFRKKLTNQNDAPL